jgi:hypothetical protein
LVSKWRGVNWIYVAQDGEHMWAHVSTVMNARIPQNAGHFFIPASINCSFQRRTLSHRVRRVCISFICEAYTEPISKTQNRNFSWWRARITAVACISLTCIDGDKRSAESEPRELMIVVLHVEGEVDFHDDHSRICLPLAVRRL